MTTAGEALFRLDAFNDALRKILAEWCTVLHSLAGRSQLTTEPGSWLSEPAVEELRLNDLVTHKERDPVHWGFTSWNDVFHRQIKPGLRPAGSINFAIKASERIAVAK
jgi:phosphatidylserine decarboxylase